MNTLRFAFGAGLASLAWSGTALAQDAAPPEEELAQPADGDGYAPEEDASAGNEIVVTATKREQTLQEIPVAVSVTTAETIERAQIRDITDLQSVVPSLRVTQAQGQFATTYNIRGFGTSGNNLGLEPSVAVFVDGVYRSRAISQISDLPDIQRVEVLRGPQSTLFGKNASAGVISIVTRKPSFRFGGISYAEAETGRLCRLPVPHGEVGAERVGEEERGPVVTAFDLVMDADAVACRHFGHAVLFSCRPACADRNR